MKLILVIINDYDAEPVIKKLLEPGYRVTRVASTGGFLRRGNTTLLIGTEDESVDDVLNIIRETCSEIVEEGQRRATIFVLDVEEYQQL
ncbi:MAG: hypothetical protein GTO18_16330 [Anaerolineales bacterium]|nr:hypothetical protein [Anaerolineales bacterium]